MDSIVLIIDMQNDYCHKEGFYSHRDGDSFTMDTVADRIVQFYKEAQMKCIPIVCFAIDYPPGDNPCVIGSWGAEYYKIIPPLLFHKTEFSCFSNKDFWKYLKENDINHIYICGFQTTFCVYNTLLESLQHGFETYLIEDLLGERVKHLPKVEQVLNYARTHAHICTSQFVLDSILGIEK